MGTSSQSLSSLSGVSTTAAAPATDGGTAAATASDVGTGTVFTGGIFRDRVAEEDIKAFSSDSVGATEDDTSDGGKQIWSLKWAWW